MESFKNQKSFARMSETSAPKTYAHHWYGREVFLQQKTALAILRDLRKNRSGFHYFIENFQT
eukprot:3481598-Pyramimonas_sp.AAC.1